MGIQSEIGHALPTMPAGLGVRRARQWSTVHVVSMEATQMVAQQATRVVLGAPVVATAMAQMREHTTFPVWLPPSGRPDLLLRRNGASQQTTVADSHIVSVKHRPVGRKT
jgi:hypothetical protein